MGSKTVEKLQLADITELFYLDRAQVVEAVGSEKVADKLLLEIDKSRTADLATVLASFSIPLVGNTASQKICRVVKHIDEITSETCSQAGLGEKVTYNLLNWLYTDFVEMREFLPFAFQSENTRSADVAADAKTVCITGKLSSFKTKAQAYAALEDAGYKVSESVTKTTDYLVDEEDKTSTKRKKAEQLGVKIILNLTQFLKETQNDWKDN